MKNKILIHDVETTDFSPKNGCLVELGISSLDLDTGEITLLFDSPIKDPRLTIKDREAWIFKNSNLTVEIVRNAPSIEDVREEIQSILNDYTKGCTAFNLPFDQSWMKSRGFTYPKLLDDPMRILAPIMQLPYPNRSGLGKFPSVTEATKFLFPDKVDYVEAHRGGSDSVDEAEIVWEMIKRGIYKV